jgi:hypothetical protein
MIELYKVSNPSSGYAFNLGSMGCAYMTRLPESPHPRYPHHIADQ